MTGAPTPGYRARPGAASVVGAGAAARDRLRPEPRISRCRSTWSSGTSGDGPCALGEYFGPKPVVLAFVYYDCPMLCTQVLSAMIEQPELLSLEPGTRLRDRDGQLRPPRDAGDGGGAQGRCPAALRAAGRGRRLAFPDRRQPSIERLTKAAGFRYVWDRGDTAVRASRRAHRPDARRPARALSVRHRVRAARSPVRARRGVRRRGSAAPVDALLLYCYHYDPMTGRYGFVVMRALRLAGGATVLVLATFVVVMVRRDRHRTSAAGHERPHPRIRHQPPRTGTLCGHGTPPCFPNRLRRWRHAWTRCISFSSASPRSSRC